MSERRGVLVPHTHWDRAWYQSFEAFRLRFVRTLDSLLDLMEQNPDFKVFTLDGQCAILEDYLEIRSHNRERLHALATAGRLALGPWYTLPDIFLAGPEAIVRNLQMGLACVARLGGRSPQAGYVPDSFGHFAQMPQILQGFGIDSYIFMRGLGQATKEELGSIFEWKAPDGSRALAVYMERGYLGASGLGLPADWGRFDGMKTDIPAAVEKLSSLIESLGRFQKEATVLLPNGCDHMPPQTELPEIVKAAAAAGVKVEIGGYADFLKLARAEEKSHCTFEGDLLGNADHPILSSVYSTRTPLKVLNHASQGLLAGVLEPWLAWTREHGVSVDAAPFVERAWKKVLQNHAHDDICGCSVDAVHQANETQFTEALEIGRTLLTESLEGMKKVGFRALGEMKTVGFQTLTSSEKPASEVWLFNPHPFALTSEVETSILVPNPAGEWATPTPECVLEGARDDGKAVAVKVVSSDAPAVRSAFLETTWGRRYRVRVCTELPPLGFVLVSLFEKSAAKSAANVTPGQNARLTSGAESNAPGGPADTSARSTFNSDTSAHATFNSDTSVHSTFNVESVLYPQGAAAIQGPFASLAVQNGKLIYSHKTAELHIGDVLAFEFEQDAGDTYSFSPVPGDSIRRAKLVAHCQDPRDPDTLHLAYELEAPLELRGASTSCATASISPTTATMPIDIEARLDVAGGVQFQIRYRNLFKNGRLRAVFAPQLVGATTMADHPFRLLEIAAELPTDYSPQKPAYPGERPYPTRYQGNFLLFDNDEKRAWFAGRGLHEVEILKRHGAPAAALTLHRSVGYLSVSGGGIRACQAGPALATPDAQLLRELRFDIGFGVTMLPRGEAMRNALAFSHPPEAREMPVLPAVYGAGPLSRSASILDLSNAEVRLSALKPAAGSPGDLAVRLYNTSGEKQKCRLRTALPVKQYARTNLTETWRAADAVTYAQAGCAFELDPFEILTLLLRTR